MKKVLNLFRAPVSKETLGFFRIAVSTFALIQFFVLLPDWMILYGPDGILPWQISEAIASENVPTLTGMMNLLAPFEVSANGTLYMVSAIYFLTLLGLLFGFKTRLMGILAWLMHLMLNTTGHLTAYGVETFMHISLFYCMVLPVGCCWSVDAARKPNVIPAHLITLSVRLIQIHLAIMYFASGVEKAMGEQWWNGDAIWIALQQDQFRQVNTNWLANYPLVAKMLCMGTLLVETFYPLGMLIPKTRKIWLTAILSMHVFIGIFLGLHLFAGLMILLNLSAYAGHCFPGFFRNRFKITGKKDTAYHEKILGKLFNEYQAQQ
jgi:hypothetical protein